MPSTSLLGQVHTHTHFTPTHIQCSNWSTSYTLLTHLECTTASWRCPKLDQSSGSSPSMFQPTTLVQATESCQLPSLTSTQGCTYSHSTAYSIPPLRKKKGKRKLIKAYFKDRLLHVKPDHLQYATSSHSRVATGRKLLKSPIVRWPEERISQVPPRTCPYSFPNRNY